MNINPFADLGISTPVIKAIHEMGYEAPTNIQSAAIPKIREGVDVAGQAQTGTGKTAAFAIPVLEKIDARSKNVQAIVMCPTRELAIQVTGEFIKLSKYLGNINITPVYGGQPIQRQIKQIKEGTHIVVGTPGRMIDHLKRGTLNLDNLKMVVLDEADEMLNMGFRDDIETILGFSSKQAPRQTIMFSATISPGIRKIMKTWFKEPEMIQIERKVTSAQGIRQYLVEVRDSMRVEGICRFLDLNNYRLSLIFCNTKRSCDALVGEMQSRGYSSDTLHGDMSQALRDKVMNKFRQGRIDVLVATDVAARGLDVDDVDAVFNFDIPQDPESYVHRIGRTGRAGRKGSAYTFASGRKNKNIRFIENKLKISIETISLPSVKEIEASYRSALLEDVKKDLESGGLKPYIEQIEALANGNFTPIEVAAALLRMRAQDKVPAALQDFPESEIKSETTRKKPRRRKDRDSFSSRSGGKKRGGKFPKRRR